ncbi:MAG TPA: DUF4339 domain-containing protein, partial [Polyangiaceae bacterium]
MSKTTNDKTWQVIALGGPTELSDWELVAALSSGELDPDSKVWRAGWAEWLPASVVGELRTALPEKSRRPERFPAPQASEAPPPALPQSTARAALETPVPSGPQGVVVRSAASSEARRVPMPTLMETERVTPTATLRPPGAIPPPPRAMPPTPSVAPRGTPLGALAPAAAPRRASDDAPSTPVS